MRKNTILFLLLVTVLTGLFCLAGCMAQNDKKKEVGMAGKRIILVGASVGKSWKLQEYPQRMNNSSVSFESIAVYQFDKSEAIEEILMRPKRKFRLTRTYLKGFFEPAPQLPQAIIIKECSSYFPEDLPMYKQLVQGWVKRIRAANIEPILATAVPVTRERAGQVQGKIEGIREYNDWVREYAKSEKLLLIDLEAAVRNSDRARYLRDDLTSGDGTHLNAKAYEVLDKLMQATLRSASLAAQ
jgi:hypothetical protein